MKLTTENIAMLSEVSEWADGIGSYDLAAIMLHCGFEVSAKHLDEVAVASFELKNEITVCVIFDFIDQDKMSDTFGESGQFWVDVVDMAVKSGDFVQRC